MGRYRVEKQASTGGRSGHPGGQKGVGAKPLFCPEAGLQNISPPLLDLRVSKLSL